ncbi:Gp37 family protein [Neomegalonema sp.]|uniref:Gp37 family protein n=1 Tax=Neomegalonema sp. TaxID=2039713 RepID=UPI0026073C21|nr:Gp37 family protein [Neomegalonema sp.]MDD2870087.1 Gp37 family protein [Neomegalonema sp.]
MTLQEIEAAIVARIAARLPDLHVEAFPDKPESFRMHHPAGAVLVAFGRESHAKPRALDLVVQERRIEWDLSILTRNLRSHVGAYDVLDALRLALTGWRAEGCGKMRPVRAEFVDQKQGVWTYVLTVEHATMTVEVADEEDASAPPTLKRIDTLSGFGSSRTPRPGCGGEEP